jgi:hypothetical protein
MSTNTNPIITVTYKDVGGQAFADTRTEYNPKTGKTTKSQIAKTTSQVYLEKQQAQQQAQTQALEQAKAKEIQRIQELQKQAQEKSKQEQIQKEQKVQALQQAQAQQNNIPSYVPTRTPNETKEVPKGSFDFYESFKEKQAQAQAQRDLLLRAERTGEQEQVTRETLPSGEIKETITTTRTYESKPKKITATDLYDFRSKQLIDTAKDIKSFQEKGTTPTDIKLGGYSVLVPQATEQSKSLLRDVAEGKTKITPSKIDSIIKARGEITREVLQTRGTSLEGKTELEKLYSQTETKIQDFAGKTAIITTGSVLATAGTIKLLSPVLIGLTATTTGKVIAGSLIGLTATDMAIQGSKVVTGAGFEGKPIARTISAVQLTGKGLGIGLGVASVKAGSINPKTYEQTKPASILEGKEGTTRIIQYGRVQTFSGKWKPVTSQINILQDGTGTYQTIISGKTSISKPFFQEKGQINSVITKVGNKIQIQLIAKSPTGKTTISKQLSEITPAGKDYSFTSSQYKSLTTDKGLIYREVILDKTSTNFLASRIKVTQQGEYTFIKPIGESSQVATQTSYKINPKELIPSRLLASKKATLSIMPSQSFAPAPISQPFTNNVFNINTGVGQFGLTTISNVPSTIPIIIPIGLTGVSSDTKPLIVSPLQPMTYTPSKTFTTSTTQTNIISQTQPIEQVTSMPLTTTTTSTSTQTTTPTQPPPTITPPPSITTQFILTTITKPEFKFKDDDKDNKEKDGLGFDVFVKKRGRFVKATGLTSLTKSQALDLGASIVSTTPSATFKIMPSSKRIGKLTNNIQGTFTRKRSTFYTKGNLFIEKRGKRITSIGELAGITYKGIRAKRTKNIWG